MGEGEETTQTFDIDKLGERMTQSINKIANNLRKLSMKYVAFSISVDELTKEKEEDDSDKVTEIQDPKSIKKFNKCKVDISSSLVKYADILDELCQTIDGNKHVKE